MNDDFEILFDKAAQLHGHKCPSLFYGVTLGLLANRVANSSTEHVILEGSSKCIRDGFNTVLQDVDLCGKVSIVTDSSACALTVGGADWQRRFCISDRVRQQVNQWNQELPVEEFQVQGLSYLKNLAENELICEEEISAQQFQELSQRKTN